MIGRWLNNLRSASKGSAIVLMYHRIAVPAADPWQLAVSPENFEQQLQTLTKSFSVVSVPKLVNMVREKRLKKRYVALTFDDGYADNYHTAKPLLEKYEVPATFFITTNNIAIKKEYWWDELENIILHAHELPPQLLIEINGELVSFDLERETILTEKLKKSHNRWTYFKLPTLRGELYLKLWRSLSPLTDPEQQRVMEQLRAWAGTKKEANPCNHCMDSKQLKDLASGELFDLGAHTASHPALAFHAKHVQQGEIEGSKLFLEALAGREINMLAYPSGSFNDETIAILKEKHYEAAFTTNHQLVTMEDDPYRFGRFQVNNWGKKDFKRNLHRWCCS